MIVLCIIFISLMKTASDSVTKDKFDTKMSCPTIVTKSQAYEQYNHG